MKTFASIKNETLSAQTDSSSTDHYLYNLSPKLKTYSKITSNKSESTEGEDSVDQPIEPKQKTLCAKVITTEDELAALSAIPVTKPSETCTSNEGSVNNERVAENGSDGSFDANLEPMQESIDKKVARTNICETSFSTQFKLFLSNLKNSALSQSMIKSENKSEKQKNTKEIIEITID